MKKRGELDAHIVFEAKDDEELDRMRTWLISKLKEAPSHSKIGFIGVAVYDENGVMHGVSTHGTPSPAAQELIESVFELEEKETA